MIFKITTVLALIGVVAAIPINRDTKIFGELASGAGFNSKGHTTAGATADEESGVAGAGLKGVGTALGFAGPGLALGAAAKSPEA